MDVQSDLGRSRDSGALSGNVAVSSLIPSLRRFTASFLVACLAGIGMARVDAAELAFDLKIEHGRVPQNMQLIRVEQGDVVTLRWRVDRPVVLHLHGYDIEKRVEPGTVGTMTFTARATGRFPIHVHAAAPSTGGHAAEEAPLVHVEVYPR
jgi:hypothetical protein